ncbi:MAG TPA: GspE/PulE family protein [bacterium]|nr:GspE/PulE family protein [bacterium]
MINNSNLFDLIRERKLIEPDIIIKIEKKFEEDKKFNFEDFLIREKIIGPEKLTELKSGIYNLPYKNLVEVEIAKDTLKFIPENIANNYLAICFQLDNVQAEVGLVKPNLKAMEAINFLAQQKNTSVKYHIISRISFNAAFKQYKEMEEEISSALEKKSQEEGIDLLQLKKEDEENILNIEDANSAPVAKIVSVIIKNAIDSRASDIHIEPYENESRVRYRIDGILKNALFLPKNIHNAVVARIKVLAKMKLDEMRIPQDGRIVLIFDNREIDFRISTLPIGSGLEKAVLRILDTVKGIITLEQLGFNNHVLSVFKRNIKKTNGIILSTGPTGSGKTTTLYSIINILNKEGVNISTLEDPIEYQIKGINQSQIRPKIGYSFATGLRSLVRQDPDIIMVGEIRDEETAELSVHAGLTGHLVLSTLHTNDALSTIFRLIDMKVEPILLASILRMIISQRLARRLCPHCKKEVEAEYKDKFMIKAKEGLKDLSPDRILLEIPEIKDVNEIDNLKIYQPVGCQRCQGTGYLERVAVGEAIEINDNLKHFIINDLNNLTIEKIKQAQEFVSIEQDGFIKVLRGLTNLEEVLRVIEV